MRPLDKQIGGDHYKQMAIQPIEFCHKNNMGSIESGVIKYVSRHPFKDGKQDLEKAIHLLEMLIDMEYPDEGPSERTEYNAIVLCQVCGKLPRDL